ncbi:short chain dehydrogenase [Sporothrix schenckii 1099-18]|uniref:Short chain dehydrogenase n=1 Tax=Sporothrix schenckii 1099-18 TaxID=1397361 RepID=A0A0F2MCX7_SPOSC|nr:short chain dehydrogenase [Sporothrix schenckii 1099-18]KJR87492.1 short chain dehydrogenase [Sporothrix schenckii 1099-18]
MSKIVVITGANTGLGYEVVKALLQNDKAAPYRIFLGCRSLDKGKAARDQVLAEVPETRSTIDLLQVDVASDASIEAAFTAVAKDVDHIDALVNNAGHAVDPQLATGAVSRRQVWTQDFDVNVSGADIMTYTFAPLLIKSREPRLLFLTSGLASQQNMAAAYYAGPAPAATGWPKTYFGSPFMYRATKCALNMLMLNWHHVLLPDGVKTFSISPGMLVTNLGNIKERLIEMGAGHPSVGGQLIQQVVAGERDTDAGKIVNSTGVMPF